MDEDTLQLAPIGLATACSLMPKWLPYVQSLGRDIVSTVAATLPPPTPVALWIIVLRETDIPAQARTWIRYLAGPKMIVTPHLDAASSLAAWIPDLRLVVHPTRAWNALDDMVQLALQHASSVLTFERIDVAQLTVLSTRGVSYVR